LFSIRSVDLFVKDFKDLYPGHPNLDAYIFGGGGNSAQLKVLAQSLPGLFVAW
jgi:hypothetical protein